MEYWTLFEYLIIVAFMLLITAKGYMVNIRPNIETVLSLDTSNLIKAFCCIIIVLHHYALRTNVPFIGGYFVSDAANQALVLFLLMSGFGIVKSELKNKTSVMKFLHKRFLKLLIPFWIVNIFTIIIYSTISPQKPYGIDIDKIRIWDNFWNFGGPQNSIIDYVTLILGLKELDAVYWFMEVVVYSYIAFLITKSLFDIEKQKKRAFFLYSVLVLIFGVYTYLQGLPAQYYRHLWALILGYYIAIFEKRCLLKKANLKNLIFIFACLNIYFILYTKVVHDLSLITFLKIDIVLIIPFIINSFNRDYTIVRESFLFRIASLSYLIYLWHTKFLNIEWYYLGGYKSVILILVCAIIMSFIVNKISVYLIRNNIKDK